MKVNASVLVLFVCLMLSQASNAAAFGCPVYDDQVPIRGVSLTIIGAGAARVTAHTEVRHYLDHPGCEGILWAKPYLTGSYPGGQCTTMAGLNHTSAATSVKEWAVDCFDLPCAQTYGGGGEHWWGLDEEHFFSTTASGTYFPCEECDDACQCAANGGFWNDPPCGDSCGCNSSPIIVDAGRGRAQYHLTSATNGVVFDVYGNDEPVKVAWTRPDSDVAFLVLDRNGNGQIDSGRELFGSSTRLVDGTLASNGFLALSEFDANADGRVDADDPVFSRLRLWFDRNHNGRSEPSELESLTGNGIIAIGTSYTESGRVDQYGNWFRYIGTLLVDGRKRDREVRIYDVYCTTTTDTTR